MQDACFKGWSVDGLIGEGSQAKVYRIIRLLEGKQYVAAMKVVDIPSKMQLKAMDVHWSDQETKRWIEALRRQAHDELHVLYRLRGHPNILDVDDHVIECHPQGFGFRISMRMPYCQMLSQYWKGHGLTKEMLLDWYSDMCKALLASHVNGVLHRDIKPDNMFVVEIGGRLLHKLGDFGISNPTTGICDSPWKTNRMYQSPNVYEGNPYTEDDDWYAMHLILYRLLNGGKLPYQSSIRDGMDQEEALHVRCMKKMVPKLDGYGDGLSDVLCLSLSNRWNAEDHKRVSELLLTDLPDGWYSNMDWMEMEERQITGISSVARETTANSYGHNFRNFHVITSLRSSGRTSLTLLLARILTSCDIVNKKEEAQRASGPWWSRSKKWNDIPRIAILDFSRHPDMGVWYEAGTSGIESLMDSPWEETSWRPYEVNEKMHLYSRGDGYLERFVPDAERLVPAIINLCNRYDLVIAEVHHEWLSPFEMLGGTLHIITTCDPGQLRALRGWLNVFKHWQNRDMGIIINRVPFKRFDDGIKDALLQALSIDRTQLSHLCHLQSLEGNLQEMVLGDELNRWKEIGRISESLRDILRMLEDNISK